MNIEHPYTDSRRLRLLDWLINSDKYILEFQNATCAVIVGTVFLLDNTNLYTRYPDTYANMKFAPAWAWGILFFSIGFFHLFCIWFGWIGYRKQILLAKTGLWFMIALMVIPADAWAISGYFYLLFFLMALRGFLQIKILKKDE